MKARLTMRKLTAAAAAVTMAGSMVSFEAFAYSDSGSYDNSFTFSNSGISAKDDSGSGYKISGTDLTINAAGTYVVSGECIEGSITVKKGTTGVVLVLDSLTLTSTSTAPVSVNKGAEAEIVIKGNNTLTDSEDPANENSTDETIAEAFEGAGIKVKSGSSLTLTGTGTLTVNGSSCKNGIKGGATSTVTVGDSANDSFTLNVNAAKNALSADGELIINGGKVNVTSADDGIKASPDEDDTDSKGTITINGGNITVNASDDAVHGEQVNVFGGDLTITAGNDALKAENALTVGKDDGSGPDIDVKKSYEGFEGAAITLKGGKGSIISSDDGMNAANGDLKNVTFELNISGGEWYVNADGDGTDSNGNMNVSGGFTEIFGAANNGNGALDIGDFGCSLVYTGGTVVAVGMNGMAVVPTSGNYIAFGTSGMGGGGFGRPGQGGQSSGSSYSISKGASIAIKDSSGSTLYEATAVKSANHIVFASDSLKSDETYTLYVNGQSTATATLTAGTGQSQGGMPGQPGQGGGQPGQGGGQPGQGGQPWQPWQPTDPTNPTDPTEPTDPTDPTEPEVTNKYPVVNSIEYSEKTHQFRLHWDAVDGAQKYGVAVYLSGKWKVADGNISASTTTFTSPKLKAGQTYKVVVCAKINGEWDKSKLGSRAFTVTVK